MKVWAQENRPELLVPQEPKLDWATLKKSLQATDDGRAVDTETGEIVPGVAINERPAKFSIKLNGGVRHGQAAAEHSYGNIRSREWHRTAYTANCKAVPLSQTGNP